MDLPRVFDTYVHFAIFCTVNFCVIFYAYSNIAAFGEDSSKPSKRGMPNNMLILYIGIHYSLLKAYILKLIMIRLILFCSLILTFVDLSYQSVGS